MFVYLCTLNQLKKKNELLRKKILNILEKKDVLTIDEYELYLYICNEKDISVIKKYPDLPESDDELV